MPRYEFCDERSKKSWEITISGSEVTAHWGRIGTEGQFKTKSLDDEAAANKDYEKQIAGKVKKGYHSAELRAIAKAEWPKLEDLEIWLGSDEYGCDCDYSDVEQILGRRDLSLKRLGIMNMEFGDEVCAGLVDSPILPGLEHLDLTMGIIGEEGARSILDNREMFSHLKTLKISGFWTSEIATELEGICKGAVIRTRGPADDDYRYVEVSE